jgi:hypothetical protein
MAFSVVHEPKGRLAAGRVMVFSTDGLRHYFYPLTAHAVGRSWCVWVLLGEFVYGQVIKYQHRRRTAADERRTLLMV